MGESEKVQLNGVSHENGKRDEEDVAKRKNMIDALEDLTAAVGGLSDRIDNFIELHQKSIPYPLVVIMFLIIIAALFGVKQVGHFHPDGELRKVAEASK